jgi:hypothetical protein
LVKFLKFLEADIASLILGCQFSHASSIFRGKTQAQDIAGWLRRDALSAGLKIRLKMVAPEMPLVRCVSDIAVSLSLRLSIP